MTVEINEEHRQIVETIANDDGSGPEVAVNILLEAGLTLFRAASEADEKVIAAVDILRSSPDSTHLMNIVKANWK